MFFSTSTLLSRSKKRRNLDFTWAGEPHDSPVGTSAQPFGKPTSANRKTITRVELSHALYRTKVGLTRKESSALADRVLKEITDAIAEGEIVKLSSFGTFTVCKKGQRIG